MGSLLAKQFSPKDLQGLALWLKADAGVTLSGSDVTAWADQSGNSRNFTKSINNTGFPTFSNGALLFTANSTYNDPNASILALSSESLNLTTPYTLIAVIRAGANSSCVFSKSNDDPKRRKYQISMGDGIIYSLESIDDQDTNFSYDTGTGSNVNIKRLIVSQYSSNTSGLLRYNGTQVATGSEYVGIDETNSASIFIGASPFGEGSGYNAEASTEMYVYEIIFYNRAITTSEIQQVEAYLNTKYAIYSPIKNTKIFIKKQNQTKLEPYSIDGGSTIYDSNNVYIFKGGSINTLGVIFDLTPANTIGSADIIYFNGNSYYKKTGGFIAAGWRDQNSIITDRSNTVIDPGTLIYFNPRSYKTTVVETGAIIEKYNTPAKISLRPTCGYQNINKLIEISGNDAPIGLTFNDIAFDYSSFASSCSSLGLDPTTILNSLGGVDFNYNYIVIRAKNGSTINTDSISNLGDGTINITSIGPSSFVNNKYYRFFVMCKTGWKIIRFYGTDYNIKNNLNLLISDITNYQTNTIGELHYNDNIGMKSIFTTDAGDKVVRNEILQSNNRINYNIGYIPNQFTAIFDYKAGGGNGADGGYFYLFAKGTQSPNMGDNDSFPAGKYLNGPDYDAYRIHFEEYVDNQQLAVSWGGYYVDLIASVGRVEDNPLDLNFADGTWRNIKIKFNQGTFEIYINNTLKLSCVDSNYNNRDKSGTNFGLGGYVGGLNNYHYFKNFRFYDYLRD
jgi:hypothetical protein